MTSLRLRLLVALLLVATGFWAVWLCLQMAYLAHEQYGWLDDALSGVAHQILTSLPQDVAVLSDDSTLLSLPPDVPTGIDKMSFQVWQLPGTGVLRSRESPASPLRPDFARGFGIQDIDGRQWRVYAITDVTGRIQVQTGKPVDDIWMLMLKASKVGLLAALVVLAVFGVTLWLVIGWSLRPVNRLQADIAARHDYDLAPLATDGLPAEVAPLVASFNRMLVRIDRAISNERRFIADAAHELRTPLAAVLTQAQVALNTPDLDQSRAALRQLITAVERGTRLAQQLLDSAWLEADPGGEQSRLDLAEVVSLVVHEFEMLAGQHRQHIVLETAYSPVSGDVDRLGILVRNLLDNAVRYSGEGSRIVVDCRPTDEGIGLRVSDDGPGVGEDCRHERLFDRFYREPGNGRRGSGIGLSLVRDIARTHGASVSIGKGPDGCGLAVHVVFPARTCVDRYKCRMG